MMKVNLTRILSERIFIIIFKVAFILHIQMFIYVTSCSYLVWWFLPPLSCLSINCVFWLLFTSCLDSCCWCVGWNISSLLIAGLEAQFSSVVVVWKIKSVIAHYRILLIRIILYFITLVLIIRYCLSERLHYVCLNLQENTKNIWLSTSYILV